MVPPPDNPWAGKEWEEMAPIFSADFDRTRRLDFTRLRLYALGRKSLATDATGAALHPNAVGEVEKGCSNLVIWAHRRVVEIACEFFNPSEGTNENLPKARKQQEEKRNRGRRRGSSRKWRRNWRAAFYRAFRCASPRSTHVGPRTQAPVRQYW
jgi:hypothetical protein